MNSYTITIHYILYLYLGCLFCILSISLQDAGIRDAMAPLHAMNLPDPSNVVLPSDESKMPSISDSPELANVDHECLTKLACALQDQLDDIEASVDKLWVLLLSVSGTLSSNVCRAFSTIYNSTAYILHWCDEL